jgi:beta-aspartyl-peptidase (threonine type)
MQYGGATLAQAAIQALASVEALGGNGGVIAVSPAGEVALEFNSEGMFRGVRTSRGRNEVAIYR